MKAKVGKYYIGESAEKIGNVSINGQAITWDFFPARVGRVTAETPLHIFINGVKLLSCSCGDEQAEIPFYLEGMDGDLVLVPEGEYPVHDGYISAISAAWEKVSDASSYVTYIDGLETQKLGSEAISYSTPVLDSGPHTLAISSVDKFGNESQLSEPISAVVYPLPPAPQDFIFTVENNALWITPASGTVENTDCTLRIYSNYMPLSQSVSEELEERFPWQEIDLSSAVFPHALLDVHSIDTTNFLFRTSLVLAGRETKSGTIQRVNSFKLSAPYDLHISQNTDGSSKCSIRFSYDWTQGKLCRRFEVRKASDNTVIFSEDASLSTFIEGYVIDELTIPTDTNICIAAIAADGSFVLSDSASITLDTTAPNTPILRRNNW